MPIWRPNNWAAILGVPFQQVALLQDALNKCGVKNELHIVKGKKPGDFDEPALSENFRAIWKFLEEVGIKSKAKDK